MTRFKTGLVTSFCMSIGMAVPAFSQEVNIYTTREPGLIQPILEAFTEETGIEANTVFLQDGIIERVKAEGQSSPADILMTVDFGALIDLVNAGLTQPVSSDILEAAIPEALRDPEGNWFALSGRARIVYAARELEIDSITYEELSDEKWKNKLCLRSGQHPYNTALFAAYIAHHGEEAAEQWLAGLKANLARPAAGGDRDGARDIAAGICDIAVGNSYYVGRMKSGNGGAEQVAWADAMKVIVPTFKDGGTHVNVTGAGVAVNAPNKDEAIQLLEYLVSDEAQKLYAQANFEHPITATAEPHPIVASFGTVVPDTINLTDILPHRTTASEIVDKLNFDTFDN